MLSFVALLFAVAALFAYANHYLLGLPRTVGLLVLALIVSGVVIALDAAVPSLGLAAALRNALERVNFGSLLLHGALGFLLFAGAHELDVDAFLKRKWTILAIATLGVLISVLIMAGGMWVIFRLVGLPIPIEWCLVFGALISPTDPVAVIGILTRLSIAPELRTVASGESLFNDGIAIVLFTIFLAKATGAAEPLGIASFLVAIFRELGGGILLGLLTGSIAYAALRGIDEYNTELLISLALVTGTYGIAEAIGVSGPVAVVVAGLMMVSIGARYAVSAATHAYLCKFWAMVEELLNSLLFLLLGFQFAVVVLRWSFFFAAGLAVPLSMVARFIGIAIPAVPLNLHAPRKLRAIALLTWGGLRGGIAVALALSLPNGEAEDYRAVLLTVTYGVVVFSVLIQGLTFERVAKALFPPGSSS